MTVALCVLLLVSREASDEFLRRPRLPACGTLDVASADVADSVRLAAIQRLSGRNSAIDMSLISEPERCFAAAMRDGAAAEFVFEYQGDDSGPLYTYFRTAPGKPGIEVIHDHRNDHWCSSDCRRVELEYCPNARSPYDLGACSRSRRSE
jgi:hypothetical protein